MPRTPPPNQPMKPKPPTTGRVTSGRGSGAGNMASAVPGPPKKKSRAEVDALLSKGGYVRKSSMQQKKR